MRQPKKFQIGGMARNYMQSRPSTMPVKRPTASPYTVSRRTRSPYDAVRPTQEISGFKPFSGPAFMDPQVYQSTVQEGLVGGLGAPTFTDRPFQTVPLGPSDRPFQTEMDQMSDRSTIDQKRADAVQAQKQRTLDFQAGVFPVEQLEADYFGIPLETLQAYRQQQRMAGQGLQSLSPPMGGTTAISQPNTGIASIPASQQLSPSTQSAPLNFSVPQLSAEEMDQREADYYGVDLDALRQFRQQRAGFRQPEASQLPPPTEAVGETPYVSSVDQTTVSADPTTQQLLFGLDGQGGFIPGAMQASETTFFNPDGTPRVTPQEVAGLTPDQERAMELARAQVGIQDRFLGGAEDLYQEGIRRSDEGLERQRELGRQALGSIERGVSEEQALRDRGLEGLLSSIGEARQLAGGATSDLYGRLGETEGIQRGAVDQFGRRLGDVEAMGTGAAERFGGRLGAAEQRGLEAAERYGGALGGIEALQRGATDAFGQRLGESEDLIRGTTGAYDQNLTRQFFDPYEELVVQQTIEDVLEGADKADMAQFAQDVSRGGESAFGSRARLTADERREALGRGLAQELAGIRSRGFTEAQRTGMGEFGRQRAAEGAAGRSLAGLSGQRLGAQQQLASGLGSLSGQRFGAETGAADRLTSGARQRLGAETGVVDLFGRTGGQQLAAQQGLASGLGQSGQQRYQAGTGLGSTLVGLGAGLGSFMQGLGGQAQQAGLVGIDTLAGFGGQQQRLAQQQLDAQRQNLLTAQQAPMAQFQSLLPFIQAVPQGQQQTRTQFVPPSSPLMAALGTGLSAFGGIGSYMNQGRDPYSNQSQGGFNPYQQQQLQQLMSQAQLGTT